MGFYSTKTSEEKRVKQLTGDIHLSEEFKEESKIETSQFIRDIISKKD